MEWYWILLICIAYALCWGITAVLLTKIDGEKEKAIIFSFIWPTLLPIAIVAWCIRKFG